MYARKMVVSLLGALVLTLSACGEEEPAPEEDCVAGGICVCETNEDCGEGEICSAFFICESAPDDDDDTGVTDAGTIDVTEDTGGFDVSEDLGFIPGACSGNRDTDGLGDEDVWPACALNCLSATEVGECTATCLENSGISSECSACHGDFATCLIGECPCLFDGEPEGACEECVNTAGQCQADLLACAGNRETTEEPPALFCTEAEREVIDVTDAFEVSRDCVESCDLDDDICVSACIATLPVGEPCALCFVEQVGCADATCIVECVEEGADCDTCRRGACIDILEECTELDLEVEAVDPVSRVRVIHMTPDATSLSGYLQGDDEAFASEIEFGASSDSSSRFAITSDTIEVREASDGASGPVLYDATFPQPPTGSEVWTLATYGSAADTTSWFISHDTMDRPSSARWQFYNGSGLLGEVDIYDIGGSERVTVASDLAYGESTDRATTEVGSYALAFDSDDDGEIDYEFGVGPFEFGSDVMLFLFDDAVATVYLMAVFVDGQTIRYNPSN